MQRTPDVSPLLDITGVSIMNTDTLVHDFYDLPYNRNWIEVDYMGLNFKHPEIHAKESTILCSRNATKRNFEEIITILSDGNFPVDDYISCEVEFTEMMTSFDQWLDPSSQVIKPLVKWQL